MCKDVHDFSLRLTFAGLDALRPHVISVSVARTSAILKPSTTGSATTDSAGFRERTALRARRRMSTRYADGRRGGYPAYSEIPLRKWSTRYVLTCDSRGGR